MTESVDIAESRNVCPNCHQKVFFNERGPPFLARMYHSRCFKCKSCNKVLYAGNFMDHDEDPFCECCYERLFAGNRRMYSSPDEIAKGEIDTTDPLKELKSSTTNGKLDIKRFSAKHNIPTKLKQTQSKSYKHHAKLHRYMIGNANESLMMEGRMKFVYSKLQDRMHKMIIHQCYTLQNKLIERVDSILQQELLEFDHNHAMKQQKRLFDPKSMDPNHNSLQNKNELRKLTNMLETHIDIPDFTDKNGTKSADADRYTNTNVIHDNDSDLDTQELIARLTTNKLI
eukprot:155310_1